VLVRKPFEEIKSESEEEKPASPGWKEFRSADRGDGCRHTAGTEAQRKK